MSYAVKEIFYTLQGEGAQTGRPAVFCRFAGCNLWSGREADRRNTELAMAFCQAHPQWQLSLQTHKLVGFR